MNRRRHFQVLVFSFALLMILLRPYAAYHITAQPDVAKTPVRVTNLLQRLIKKKDEHQRLADNDLIAMPQPQNGRAVPAVRTLFITQLFLVLAPAASHPYSLAHIFRSFFNKHYLLFASLRI